ncbi:MAG: copper resistance protein CopC, partial [bacterium]|nr:copper resistance protein CopC [bacterium]
MIRFHRPAVALVAALLAIVALASPAAAHASLVRSNPADASVLDDAPGQAELTFSEPVSVEGSSVEFIDAEGTRHDVEIVGHGQSTSVLLIDLGDIPDGLYSLRWTAFSSSDGHVTKGMLVWGIGTDADLSQADFAAPSEPVPPVEVLTRWALYIGLAAVLGAFLVQAGVLATVQRRFSAASEAPWHQTAANRVESIVRVGSRIAAAAAVLLIVEQLWKAYSAGGQGVLAAIETSLLSTAWGRWALLRAIALAVLALVLPRLQSRSHREALMMVAIGSAVLAQAAGGHSA